MRQQAHWYDGWKFGLVMAAWWISVCLIVGLMSNCAATAVCEPVERRILDAVEAETGGTCEMDGPTAALCDSGHVVVFDQPGYATVYWNWMTSSVAPWGHVECPLYCSAECFVTRGSWH